MQDLQKKINDSSATHSSTNSTMLITYIDYKTLSKKHSYNFLGSYVKTVINGKILKRMRISTQPSVFQPPD